MYMIAEQLITRRHPSPVTRLPVTSDPSPAQPQPLMVARNVLGVYLILRFNSSSFRFVIRHFNTSSFQFFGLILCTGFGVLMAHVRWLLAQPLSSGFK